MFKQNFNHIWIYNGMDQISKYGILNCMKCLNDWTKFKQWMMFKSNVNKLKKIVIVYQAWSKPQQRLCLNQLLNPTSIKHERHVKFNEIHQTKCFYHNCNECQNMKIPTSKTITL